MNKQVEELAKRYGIEIKKVESEQGGLFYKDEQGIEIKIDDIFELDDYEVPQYKSVSFDKCGTYSIYVSIASLMVNAA